MKRKTFNAAGKASPKPKGPTTFDGHRTPKRANANAHTMSFGDVMAAIWLASRRKRA